MSMVIAENATTLRMAVVGCDYITSLGLEQLLSGADFIDVVGSVPKAEDMMELVTGESLDLVLVDAGIPESALFQTCRTLKNLESSPTVVVMGDVPFHVAESLVFEGVRAILHHGVIAQDLPVALRMIHTGGALLLSTLARDTLLDRGRSVCPQLRANFGTLNNRERVVAEGIAEGMTNSELAGSMHLSEATVKLLVSHVMNKLGVSNRVQIAVAVTKAHIV